MLKLYVCEDDCAQKENITTWINYHLLKKELEMEVAFSTHDPHALLSYIEKSNDLGLYFLDVDLKQDINGLELAQKIRKHDPQGFIVFITAHENFMPITFKYRVEALDYIIKDDIKEIRSRIASCIDDAIEKFNNRANEPQHNYVFESLDKKIISVPFKKILFFQSVHGKTRRVILHTDNACHEYHGQLKDIMKELDNRFFFSHKSYILNVHAVVSYDKEKRRAIMRGNYKCEVSIRNMRSFMKIFLKECNKNLM